jgi:hypothetical protein
MADQFCPNCGTEVEADARFCPSCGTTLTGQDQGEQIPAAPAWPPPEPSAEDAAPAAPDELADEPMHEPMDQPTVTVAQQPDATALPPPPAQPASAPSAEPAAAPPPPPAPAVAQAATEATTSTELPFTWPTLLSGWLIGGGSLLGAAVLIPRLAGNGYLVSMLLFLALLGIAATVFLADHVPAIPQLRLIVLCTTLIGLGVGLARAAFLIQGIDTIFLVAMLAAAGGAILIDLDRDRPFPPPERPGS